MEELINDENYLSHYINGTFSAVLMYRGDHCDLHLFIDDKPETVMTKFKPAEGIEWDTVEAMAQALFFAVLKLGDTDPEYFEGHTPAHLAWLSEKRSENVRLDIMEFEEGDQTLLRYNFNKETGIEHLPTTVIFRKYRDGDIIAVFPYEKVSDGYCSSYMHIGQHGAADGPGVVSMTKPATPDEYAELKRELEGIGYVLEIKTRINRRKYAEATK